jgi:hypothetical protein
MLIGALLIIAGLGLALAVTMVLLVMQLFVNMVTLPFTQELRWYGPGPLDADPDLRAAVLTATSVGSVLLVVGAIRRYAFESAPRS